MQISICLQPPYEKEIYLIQEIFFNIISFFINALISVVNIIIYTKLYTVKVSDQNTTNNYVLGYRLTDPPLIGTLPKIEKIS